MANSQTRHPHPMANRSKSLFGPFAVAPVDDLSSGARCVHACFDSTMAALSAPAPVSSAEAVMGGGRQNSSSSEETEEGFVVVGDEVGAPWDTNHTNQPTPTLVSSAIQSARHTWTSILPSRLKSTASPLPSLSSPQQRQPSTQDVSAWELEPPLEDAAGFGTRGGTKMPESASSSGETKSRLVQAQLTDSDQAQRPGGLFFVAQEQRNDSLGESAAWQRPKEVAGSGEEEGRRAAVLKAWNSKKAREERSERWARDILSGRETLREGWYERGGEAASGRTKEQMEAREARIKEQIWRRGTKEGRLASLRKRTSEMTLEDGWYERIGGAASGRTMEEAELQVREQMWRKRIRGSPAALERRRAGEARDAASRGLGAGL